MRERDPEHLLYESTKPGPRGIGPLLLTPLQLLGRLVALVQPPRVHRHRCFGVQANDRSPGISMATLTVSSWPVSDRRV